MPSNLNTAQAKLNSLKITTMNAITELEIRAEAARSQGDTAAEDKHITKAIELAQASVHIRKTEDKIRESIPLMPVISKLDAIASDGRATLASLKKAVDALGQAAKLVQILTRLVSLA